MYPIRILGEDPIPPEGTCYIVAGNGILIRKDTGLVDALVPVDTISSLPVLEPRAALRLPALPPEEVARSLSFFREVHASFGTEAVLLIHYAPGTGRFHFHCPSQAPARADVQFSRKDRFPGFQLVGCLHSHSRAIALPSYFLDAHSAASFDGLHLIVGSLHLRYLTAYAAVVVNGCWFPQDPAAAMPGMRKVPWKPRRLPPGRSPSFYAFDPPAGAALPIPPEWMERLSPRPRAAKRSRIAQGGAPCTSRT